MWVNAKYIVLNALEDRGQVDDTLERLCLRWVEECVVLLGIVPEYYQKADEVPIVGGQIRKPKGLLSVRRMWLCGQGEIVPTYYGGKRNRELFNPDGCCEFYTLTRQSGILLMEDDTCFFSATQPIDCYEKALIEYNGLIYDAEGNVRVPLVAQQAVTQYLEYKLTKREMKTDRQKVSRVEVSEEYETWLRDMGVAYGRMKMPSMATLTERVEQKFRINLPTPRARLR